jgi:hypothetical protein
MVMSKKEYRQHSRVRAWAQQHAQDHKDMCTSKKCGGRFDVWWVARHPQASPSVVTDLVKDKVRTTLHVCPYLLARLADGSVPWLDAAERAVYARRSPAEVKTLLGTAVRPKVENNSPEDEPVEIISVRENTPRTRRPSAYQNRPSVPDASTYGAIVSRLSGGR